MMTALTFDLTDNQCPKGRGFCVIPSTYSNPCVAATVEVKAVLVWADFNVINSAVKYIQYSKDILWLPNDKMEVWRLRPK